MVKLFIRFGFLLSLLFGIHANAQSIQSDSTTVEKCLTNNQFDDRYASYSPDGNSILFESNRTGLWQVFMMDKYGQNERQLSDGKLDYRRPSWHPNGKQILAENLSGLSSGLILIDINTKEVKPLLLKGYYSGPLFAKFSPSGDKIAFSAKAADSLFHIFIYDLFNQEEKSLVKSAQKVHFPNWSQDGEFMTFFSRMHTAGKDDEIYTINLATKKNQRLTKWPKHNFCPSFSPNGRKIAYVTSMTDTRPEIFLMSNKGKNTRRITFNADGDTLPNWHPNGKELIITGYRNGNYEICTINLRSVKK